MRRSILLVCIAIAVAVAPSACGPAGRERVVSIAEASAFQAAASAVAYADGVEAALIVSAAARILAEVKARGGALEDYDIEYAKWSATSGHGDRQMRIEKALGLLRLVGQYLGGMPAPGARQAAIDAADVIESVLVELGAIGIAVPESALVAASALRTLAGTIS